MEKSRKDSQKLTELYEEMTSGAVLGGGEGHGGDLTNTDWYAPGDNRNPYYLGVHSRWEVYDPEKERQEKEKKAKKSAKKRGRKAKKSRTNN